MALGTITLTWMIEQDRTIGYVSKQSGIDPERLINLITGAEPTPDEAAALATVTDIPVDELASRASPAQPNAAIDPYQCYTVAEAARLLGVGPDTVRKELKQGTLEHVVLGERALRIPRRALARRLGYPDDRRDRNVPTVMPPQTPPDGPTGAHRRLF